MSLNHNQNWADAGLRVTWNLFNILSGPRQKELAEMQVEIAKVQRLALNMAVLTQVHVAWRDYVGRQRQYELSNTLFEIDQKIHEHTRAGAANDAQSKVNEIRSKVTELMADFRRFQSYASMQATYGQLIASVGEDPIPLHTALDEATPILKISEQVRTGLQGTPKAGL